MKFWLVKTDPETYSWEDLVKDKKTSWDGVRNYQARNYLQEMKKGDQVIFYHSRSDLAAVGIARITRESYPDTTTDDPRWVAVELQAEKPFRNKVSLEEIKGHPKLSDIALLKQSRLSVVPLTELEFKTLVTLAG